MPGKRRGGKVWLILLIFGMALLLIGAMMSARPTPSKGDIFDSIAPDSAKPLKGFTDTQIAAVCGAGFFLSIGGGFLGLMEALIAHWPRRQICPSCGAKGSGEYCSKCGAMLWERIPVGMASSSPAGGAFEALPLKQPPRAPRL